MRDTLIIFVDSLPYRTLSQMPFLNAAPEIWPIIPGFGYSVNIHAELFAGLLPDDVGYFGEWTYDPELSPGWKWRSILPLLDKLFRPYILNRGLQHLLMQGYRPGRIMINIPLRDLDKFALKGDHILDNPQSFPHPSLFSKFPHLKVLSIPHLPKGERDLSLYRSALNTVHQEGSMLLPLPDLDGFGHAYGITGTPYRAHLDFLDASIATLANKYRAAHPDGHVFVISDHGMVNVAQGITLDIEAYAGKASSQTYVYFTDANLLRVWVLDEGKNDVIHTYLQQLGRGQLVTPEERQTYGLTSPGFGDFIFVLDEGLAFAPSTFARHKPAGMHGYHPLAPGQQAVCSHFGPPWQGDSPQRMSDVYHMLCSALGGTW
ncbi:MAG: hypothetical protein E4H27_06665 [Anaerolineales bacterium]|nr:MAG: hypothetical protein E4H27_06665 [Anaerolineales bacterium]